MTPYRAPSPSAARSRVVVLEHALSVVLRVAGLAVLGGGVAAFKGTEPVLTVLCAAAGAGT